MTIHREIDVSGIDPHPLREQPAPMLEWVKIANLRIDDRYQRPLGGRNWAAIRKIAENFDWCAFGPILCAPIEGGLYAVIDGQHRVHGAAICGIKQVPAMIVPVPPAAQALAFVKVNSGIRVTGHQTFRAELAAGNPEALAIASACQAAGCEALTYNPSAATKRPRQVSSIGFLRACINRGESAQLTAALSSLASYDDKGRTGLYSDYVLAPWVAAVVKTGVLDVDRLTRALHLRDPFHTIEAAARLAQAEQKSAGISKRDALAKQIEAAA